MNWDDLRFFLAVHRHGTHSAAGRSLGVNHVTVGRRLRALEDALGAPLFHASPRGFELSDAGRELLKGAEAMEMGAMQAQRVKQTRSMRIAGIVRVATSQMLADEIVSAAAARLVESHRDLQLDILEGTQMVSLTRQEADLSVRLQLDGRVEAGAEVRVRQLGQIQWKFFATAEFANRYDLGSGKSLAGVPLVVYNDQAPGRPGESWMVGNLTAPNVVCQTNGMSTARSVAAQGMAAAVLPRAYGEKSGLVPVTDSVRLSYAILAIHPDLQRAEKYRTVFDALIEAAAASNMFDQ